MTAVDAYVADDAVDAETLQMLRDSVRRFNEQGGLRRVRNLRKTQPGFDRDAWHEMAQQGWLGTIIPEESGGLGLPFAAMQVIVEELARGLSPEPVVGCAVHAATVLLGCRESGRGTELLSQIASGDKIYAVAESDIAITRDGNAMLLGGTARHILPALATDGFIVAARDGAKTLVVFVDAAAPGISITPENRADGTFSGTITFVEVPVSAESVLAEGAAASAALARGRAAATLMTAAELFGAMDQALSITLDYMKTRVQFDRPIGSFQALQHRVVDLYIQKELSRSVLAEAIAALDESDDLELIEMEASRAKARCSSAGLLIGREAIKLHGAIGVTDEYDVGLYLKRLLSLAALHGNAPAHRTRYGAVLARRQGGLDEGRGMVAAVPAEFMAEQKLAVDWNSFSNDAFRAGIRAYLEAYYPQHLRGLGRRGTPGEMADWLDRMVRKGWIAPAWPVEHGGMGLSPAKQVIFIEERERVGVARNPDQGVVMFGPMLMRYGTDEQKRRFLPKIVTNEHIWCQGYSEPNAGSDLASLRTEAVRDGETFIINGSKIWTTMAHHATHMFLLARTNKAVKKQEGISFFVLDLKTSGVTIRPIGNLAGHEEFCGVFFDEVRVPAENLVGDLDKGWSVAKSLLGFERLNNGSPRRVQGPLKLLQQVADARSLALDPVYREKYTAIYLDITDLKSAYSRFSDIVGNGLMPGPEISQLKIWAGECAQRLSELLIETAGEEGGIVGRQAFGSADIDVLAPFYAMFPSQIASGSNDIQRNVLAQRVLGLPK
ncbi:acyl-CoA dehydrogenase [Devosia ginsengisoli]|uniref:acyl-CoA dehydrogenase n=1 Tax=Devosia ginsengisoli TaxID=400770 RepID=UPI0026E9779C|nr:acyl-CoA dehydrogenase [Devosia ginsengisoli]MCR6672614.1 acyl-CoA dehydrogenase [Devosia ginsengisoli]